MYKAKIIHDQHCDSPFDSCDCLGRMIKGRKDVISFFNDLCYFYLPSVYDRYDIGRWSNDITDLSVRDRDRLRKHIDGMYLFHDDYDFEDEFVYIVEKKEILRQWQVSRLTKSIVDKTQSLLKSEMDTYKAWCEGDCWGYKVTKKGFLKDKVIDSCWGYIGKEYLIQDLQSQYPNIKLEGE